MTDRAAEPETITALADLIARDLQSGVIAPGTWLKQIALSARYDASRPSVRRALDQLVQSRLVRHIANRGYYAFEPNDRTDAEIAEIRVALETTAAARIVARATEADIAALRQLAQHFEALLRTGTLMELSDANQHFHRRMLGLCDNVELVKLILSVRQRTSAAPVSQWRTLMHIEASAAEHHAMVAAIAKRDSAELRRIIAGHILQAERNRPGWQAADLGE